jgi:hypothetical protein
MSPSTRTNSASPPARSIVSGELDAAVAPVRAFGKTFVAFCPEVPLDGRLLSRFFFVTFLLRSAAFCPRAAGRAGAGCGGAGGGG